MTPKNVSEELGIGLNLVYRQLRAGKIPHVKCGDKYLISRTALERWLSGGQLNIESTCQKEQSNN
jgi:excisionase family DNA binding protein